MPVGISVLWKLTSYHSGPNQNQVPDGPSSPGQGLNREKKGTFEGFEGCIGVCKVWVMGQ